MKKLTQILLEQKYTERMVEDFNDANLDLANLKIEELVTMKDNLTKVIAALDDLSRSIDEELENNKPKKVVSDLLDSYIGDSNTDSSNAIAITMEPKNESRDGFEIGLELEEASQDETFDDGDTNKEDFGYDNEDVEDEEADNDGFCIGINPEDIVKKIAEELLNSRKTKTAKTEKTAIKSKKESENKIKASDKIYKAVELARKYNIGVPYLTTGSIIKMIEQGKVKEDEVMIPIINTYKYLIETRRASKEDAMYMLSVINEVINLEDMLKSAILGSLFKKSM